VDALFAAVHPPPKDVNEVVFDDGWDTASQLVLKLSWDNKRPARANFTLRKRKSSAGVINGK
jgi:hypothetical protein